MRRFARACVSPPRAAVSEAHDHAEIRAGLPSRGWVAIVSLPRWAGGPDHFADFPNSWSLLRCRWAVEMISNRMLWALFATGLILAVITLLADQSIRVGVLVGIGVFGTALFVRRMGRHDEE